MLGLLLESSSVVSAERLRISWGPRRRFRALYKSRDYDYDYESRLNQLYQIRLEDN